MARDRRWYRRTPAAVTSAAFLVAAALGPAGGAELPGKPMAERWCAACHVVTAEQSAVSEGAAPTFAAIAAMRSDEDLTAFLTAPHPPMAALGLARREVADLVAYIRSLAP